MNTSQKPGTVSSCQFLLLLSPSNSQKHFLLRQRISNHATMSFQVNRGKFNSRPGLWKRSLVSLSHAKHRLWLVRSEKCLKGSFWVIKFYQNQDKWLLLKMLNILKWITNFRAKHFLFLLCFTELTNTLLFLLIPWCFFLFYLLTFLLLRL